MLERLIEWSARNRLLVGMLVFLISAAGLWATFNTPVDAIPDLSPVQVIVKANYPGQGPRVVEEQVTYPLTTALLSVPYAETVRGYSMFGNSYVYVIFEDGTDMYWARSRVLEYLNQVSDDLPEGVQPVLGPDATGVGWVYEYAFIDTTGRHSLAELRAIQDFFLSYELQSIEGVAEIATVGGFEKQYQVVVDPQKLAAYGVTISHVKMALQRSNRDVGARLLAMGGREFIVRSPAYLEGIEDIRNVALRAEGGTPITIADVARVQLGPELRRGIADLNGEGEVVGGIVIMRSGGNAMKVIERVKERLLELEASLPEGVEVIPTYDRSALIERAVDTLVHKLWEEMLVVALIVILFLLHIRSAFVAIITVPIGLLISLLAMYLLGINANIMSLGGLAIAIGVMVDASLVMVENAHKHIERLRAAKANGRTPSDGDGQNGSAGNGGDFLARARRWFTRPEGSPALSHTERTRAVITAAKEVGPSLFFALLIVTVAFLPVFGLGNVSGRLFRPLAFTKTFAMAAASLLSVTLVPALMVIFVKGKIRSEKKNPVARFFMRGYRPIIRYVLRRPAPVLAAAGVIFVLTLLPVQRLVLGETYVPFPQIGSEFMPPLDEGDILYMPTTLPGVSPQKAKEVLQQTDRILASFPEVKRVFGKIGRAETATDPAPLSMIETIIQLRPRSEWREGVTKDELIRQMNQALQIPGLTNAWTQPIQTRIDMMATGIKTPVGIKVAGEDLETLGRIGRQLEAVLRPLEGTRSVFAERVMGGSFLDIEVNRLAAARYGLTTGDVQDVIQTAIGGMPVTTTVEGLERFSVNVRYPRAYRNDLSDLREVLVPTPSGAQIPLGQLANFQRVEGPPMIKSENARPNAWVFVDLEQGVPVGTYVQEAKEVVVEQVELPSGYALNWSGKYKYMQEANERLRVLVPLTLAIIFLLLFLHFRNVTETLILMITLPFAIVGAIWLMAILSYNWSIAVGVGMIAVAGLAAETGVVMQVYLDEALERYHREGRLTSRKLLNAALEEGAVDRLRPKLMTVFAMTFGLLPLMFGTGAGSEVMKRIAAPMVGGLVSSTILTLVVIPAVYVVVMQHRSRRPFGGHSTGMAETEAEPQKALAPA